MHCFILTLSLSAYPLHPETSHAYSLQEVSMNPVDYPCSRKSHNRILYPASFYPPLLNFIYRTTAFLLSIAMSLFAR